MFAIRVQLYCSGNQGSRLDFATLLHLPEAKEAGVRIANNVIFGVKLEAQEPKTEYMTLDRSWKLEALEPTGTQNRSTVVSQLWQDNAGRLAPSISGSRWFKEAESWKQNEGR